MAARALASLAYLPIPGLQAVPVLADPEDRLVRFHAWQAGVLTALVYVVFLVVGLLAGISSAAPYQLLLGLLAGLAMLTALAALAAGAVAAARGRFLRLPGIHAGLAAAWRRGRPQTGA